MAQKTVKVGNLTLGNQQPFVLFGGMNVLNPVIWRLKWPPSMLKSPSDWVFPMSSRRPLTRRIARRCIHFEGRDSPRCQNTCRDQGSFQGSCDYGYS